MADEGSIIDAIAQMENDEIKSSLVEVLVLMAIYDGELAKEERDFLIKIAEELDVPLDINAVERRSEDYRVVIERNIFQKTAGNAKGAAVTVGGKVSGVFGNIFRRKKDEGDNTGTDAPVVICANCKNEIAVGYNFCPFCGQSVTTQKNHLA